MIVKYSITSQFRLFFTITVNKIVQKSQNNSIIRNEMIFLGFNGTVPHNFYYFFVFLDLSPVASLK